MTYTDDDGVKDNLLEWFDVGDVIDRILGRIINACSFSRDNNF